MLHQVSQNFYETILHNRFLDRKVSEFGGKSSSDELGLRRNQMVYEVSEAVTA